ncbi:HK97 family phage prohead protease [Photobacterium swingsii]|uniref:HK97 family phage prohead protease n=1 Tax=Photobacterium swingsii TaxID=680026 RepID=UPI003D0BC98D
MSKQLDILIKSFEVEEGEQGVFTAYANVKWFKDKAGDVSVDGAFIKSIEAAKAKGRLPKMLLQHDYKQVCGVWLEMEEDEKGLRVKGQLALNTSIGRETYELMKMGALDSLSIGYIVKKERYDPHTKTNYLEELDIREVSIVTFECNEESLIDSVKEDELQLQYKNLQEQPIEPETNDLNTVTEQEESAEIEVLNTVTEQEETNEEVQPEPINAELMAKLDELVISIKLSSLI